MKIGFLSSASIAVVCMGAVSSYADGVIGTIHAEGIRRLSEAAVVHCSGLHESDPFSKEALDAATQRLVDSGFFSFANYSYSPKMEGGKRVYSVTLKIQEDVAHIVPVILDLPGIDEQAIWRQLEKMDPMLKPLMPNNDAASAYYQHAIETALQKMNRPAQIVLKQSVDLRTGKMSNIVRPANAPKLAAVEFKGNRGVDSSTLEKVIHPIVIDRDYSEMELRQVVNLNLTPIYGQYGYLRVQYGQIAAAQQGSQITATINVEEGQTWKLGAVEITGEDLPLEEMKHHAKFPVGRLANWKQIEQGIEDMQIPLKKTGYLAREVGEPQRLFHEESGSVDVRVTVRKGLQYRFGELQFPNIPAKVAEAIRAGWHLSGGDPFDETARFTMDPSVVNGLLKQGLAPSYTQRVRPGSQVVDLIWSLKQNP